MVDDILALIVKRIGQQTCADLIPFLASGTRSRDFVYRDDVFHLADIFPLCYDATYIFKNVPEWFFLTDVYKLATRQPSTLSLSDLSQRGYRPTTPQHSLP